MIQNGVSPSDGIQSHSYNPIFIKYEPGCNILENSTSNLYETLDRIQKCRNKSQWNPKLFLETTTVYEAWTLLQYPWKLNLQSLWNLA